MRISVKARYGLSAMICMSQNYTSGEYIAIISLSEKLQLSKIYLEQVFSLLKRAELVISTKGPQGGYQLARKPKEINMYDILSAIDAALFEKTEATVLDSALTIEKVMQEMVFDQLDNSTVTALSAITLDDLVQEVEKQSSQKGYMYYL